VVAREDKLAEPRKAYDCVDPKEGLQVLGSPGKACCYALNSAPCSYLVFTQLGLEKYHHVFLFFSSLFCYFVKSHALDMAAWFHIAFVDVLVICFKKLCEP